MIFFIAKCDNKCLFKMTSNHSQSCHFLNQIHVLIYFSNFIRVIVLMKFYSITIIYGKIDIMSYYLTTYDKKTILTVIVSMPFNSIFNYYSATIDGSQLLIDEICFYKKYIHFFIFCVKQELLCFTKVPGHLSI